MSKFSLLICSGVISAVAAVKVTSSVRLVDKSSECEKAITSWFDAKTTQSIGFPLNPNTASYPLLAESIGWSIGPSLTFQKDFTAAFPRYMASLLHKHSAKISDWPEFVENKLKHLVSAFQLGVQQQDEQNKDGQGKHMHGYRRVFWEAQDPNALFRYSMRIFKTLSVVRDYAEDDYSAESLQTYIRENFVLPTQHAIEKETAELIDAMPEQYKNRVWGKLFLERYFSQQVQDFTDRQKAVMSKMYEQIVGKAYVIQSSAAKKELKDDVADTVGSHSGSDTEDDRLSDNGETCVTMSKEVEIKHDHFKTQASNAPHEIPTAVI